MLQSSGLVRDLVFWIVLVSQILQNSSRLKQRKGGRGGRTGTFGVGDGGYSSVQRHLEELGSLLFALGDVDVDGLVLQLKQLESNGDFDSVRGGESVESDGHCVVVGCV